MNKKVLIVDDQRGIRFLLEEIIRSEGYRVRSCENGIQAFAEIERGEPDLIIVDYQLPIKNGAEIIKELESKGYLIPTIVMSGLIEEVKEVTAELQSVKDYFSKPFDIVKAKEQINYLLQG
ncbi:response regulator [Amphibacillus sp. MSJ-3]|uniref:response regulator n=1 Tax=Amphibacillus sp. MSJ-3 TaxID=2841505 RepID=UPI001C0E8F11|nr:response regulator [Amphibacillus sp. MSJ-3]MBU5594844.1 response regulator [Amphibacillus sp. MSJ-3]